MPLPINLKLRLKFPATADQCLGLEVLSNDKSSCER